MCPADARRGPLRGIRIVEFAGIGPAPFGAMLLADLGATVLRIDRFGGYPPPDESLDFETMGDAAIFNRSRRTVRVNLKTPAGRKLVLRLVAGADALIEGYRPGTMERLGLGPDECLAANPRIVYARMTGWGQTGPLARTAGHDLNYLALSGALSLFARGDAMPAGLPPLVGDMGGGGLFMAFGLLAGVIEARGSGRGQVVDSAIIDGSAALYALLKALSKAGAHREPAGANTLDGGRHFYRTYRCLDGGHVAVGAIEPAFRKVLLEKLHLLQDRDFHETSADADARCTQRLAAIFASQPRDHWASFFEGTDACVTPLLSMEEAERHPANGAREAFIEIGGVMQHAPAPRFSRTPGSVAVSPADASRHDGNALVEWEITTAEIEAARTAGAIE